MTNNAIIAAEKRSRLASSPRRRRYPPPESPPPPMVPPRPVDFGVWRRMPSIARTPTTTCATVRAVLTQQRLLDTASAEYRCIGGGRSLGGGTVRHRDVTHSFGSVCPKSLSFLLFWDQG